MAQNEPPENKSKKEQEGSFRRVRNAVILPDGSRREPMGSGVITGLLGVGGMANVYEIWNPQLEVSRAVKLLHPNYTEEAKQRFQTEIKITAKFHHANIIEIHAVGQWNSLPYIEMERIDGQTLEKIISDRGALPVEVCTSIGIMIGRALRYAHNQEYVIYGKTYHGVIHRDLKPSNIMVSTAGVLKLMDFGIARPTDASIHTTDGSILGTMQYLSPEQLDGKEPDIRTDIYSLGTILYEMITGVKAFPDPNVSKLMLSKIKNDFKQLDQFDLKIPVKFRRLVHRCLMHDRDKRIPDASTFLAEITRIHRNVSQSNPEQVLRQFMSIADGGRIIVSLRKRIPVLLIGSALSLAAVFFGLLRLGPDLLSRLREDNQPDKIQIESIKAIPQVESDSAPELKVQSPPSSVSLVQVQKKPETLKKAVSVPQSPPAPVTLLEKLIAQYGTSDILTIFVKEVQNQHFSNALEIYNRLSDQDKGSDKGVIFRIRALRQLGKRSELKEVLFSKDVRDGEFYLERARLYLETGNLQNAMKDLDLCAHTTAAYLDNKTLRLERIYTLARCKSKEFDSKPSVVLKNAALDSWFEVKVELQTSKDHRYFKEADLEMQRITQKMNDKG